MRVGIESHCNLAPFELVKVGDRCNSYQLFFWRFLLLLKCSNSPLHPHRLSNLLIFLAGECTFKDSPACFLCLEDPYNN